MLYFGLHETPPAVDEKGALVEIALEEAERSGSLEIQWQRPLETKLDSLAERLFLQKPFTLSRLVSIDAVLEDLQT